MSHLDTANHSQPPSMLRIEAVQRFLDGQVSIFYLYDHPDGTTTQVRMGKERLHRVAPGDTGETLVPSFRMRHKDAQKLYTALGLALGKPSIDLLEQRLKTMETHLNDLRKLLSLLPPG